MFTIYNINCFLYYANFVRFHMSGYYILCNEASNQVHAPKQDSGRLVGTRKALYIYACDTVISLPISC